MLSYPVRVPTGPKQVHNHPYLERGDINRILQKTTDHINTILIEDPREHYVRKFDYGGIASAIGEDPDVVRELIYVFDSGSNGVTVFKGDYEKATNSRDNSRNEPD